MNFQQLRYVRETVRNGLNLTLAAAAVHSSQPGVSKQIRELESELGVDIFVRRGKRFVGLTEPGRAAVDIIERILSEAHNLRTIGAEFAGEESGALKIATTHTQARYALPPVVNTFKKRYPQVHLALVQGTPPQIAEWVRRGDVDIGIATETLAQSPELATLPAYEWRHAVVVPKKHALVAQRGGRAAATAITLEALAKFPIVTYDPAFTGRGHIDAAFAARDLKPDIVMTAIDSDVIKTYVTLGLGIGIIAAMAFDEKRDSNLVALDAGHLFGTNVTRVAVRKGAFLRGYAYAFIEAFAPALTREKQEAAFSGELV
jgi:LysR family transcriptional regulator, cys regulon transcriptional activator